MDNKKIQLLGLVGYFKLTILQKITQLVQKIHPTFTIPLKLKLKTYQYPLWVRCGTSDYPCFHLIFIQEEFKEVYPLIPGNVNHMIDCGTNVGYTIKYFLEKRKFLSVIGLEPDISNFKMAKKNLSYFSNQVILLNKAIWSHKSYVKVVDGKYGNGGKWALTVVETDDKVGIEAISLNELIQEKGVTAYYVKMDIEGAEKIVLAKHTQWMSHTALLSVELHDEECEKIFKNFEFEHHLQYIGLFEEMHCLINPQLATKKFNENIVF